MNKIKICIVRLSAIGDIVYSLSPLQFLKKQKNIQIDWLVEDRFKELLQKAKYIDNILTIDLKSIKKNRFNIFSQISLLKQYSKNRYDFIIDAQGLIKSAISSYFLKSDNTKIIGFDKNSIREKFASYFYDIKIASNYSKNVLFRNKDVICNYFGCQIDKNDFINKNSLFKTNYIEANFDIVFVVGASKINKIYPKEKFFNLAKLLKDYKILVVWGDEKEKEIALFLSKLDNVKVAKKLSLSMLIDTLNQAKLVIGNDTGPTHIAWGLNKKTITIYGNTPHFRNSFVTDKNLVVYSNSFVDPLKLDKNDFSIKDIDEKKIYKLVKELL